MNILTWLVDPTQRMQYSLRRAEQRGLVRMQEPLRRALETADELGIQFYSQRLDQYRQVLRDIAPAARDARKTLPELPMPTIVPAPPPMPAQVPGYVVSSATLAQAYANLTRTLPGTQEEPEWMLAVTGVKYAELNVRSLEQLLDVRLAQQSAARAAFDMQDFGRIAILLEEHGQALHAIFHSHRFPGQPQPSAVDWRLQEILDKGGYPAIQAVFSEDGYIRFFARRPFTVSVTGKGVECVDPKTFLYRLVHFGTLPHAGDAPARPHGSLALRPLPAHQRR